MDVSLTPDLETLVAAKGSSSRYLSTSEVVCDALRLFEQHEKMRKVKQQAKLKAGFDDVQQGR